MEGRRRSFHGQEQRVWLADLSFSRELAKAAEPPKE